MSVLSLTTVRPELVEGQQPEALRQDQGERGELPITENLQQVLSEYK